VQKTFKKGELTSTMKHWGRKLESAPTLGVITSHLPYSEDKKRKILVRVVGSAPI
jgi:hypothetical protein